ncbi:unnamed protein product [Phyllotreta striolata]|uniref:Uncharacterized protein n=1 Tax=Phyllotreta striolata TaxID=444603 RepID=A0A9N9XMM2_PHYSR|nr:unnamed protein product [Phyllotreta striolata]
MSVVQLVKNLIAKNTTNSRLLVPNARIVSRAGLCDAARGANAPQVLPGLLKQLVDEPKRFRLYYGRPSLVDPPPDNRVWCPPALPGSGEPALLGSSRCKRKKCKRKAKKYKRKYKKYKKKAKKYKRKYKKCKKKRKKCKKKNKKYKKKYKKCKKKKKRCKKKKKKCKKKLRKHKKKCAPGDEMAGMPVIVK